MIILNWTNDLGQHTGHMAEGYKLQWAMETVERVQGGTTSQTPSQLN
jgi:hypothetical protein